MKSQRSSTQHTLAAKYHAVEEDPQRMVCPHEWRCRHYILLLVLARWIVYPSARIEISTVRLNIVASRKKYTNSGPGSYLNVKDSTASCGRTVSRWGISLKPETKQTRRRVERSVQVGLTCSKSTWASRGPVEGSEASIMHTGNSGRTLHRPNDALVQQPMVRTSQSSKLGSS